MRVLVVVDGDKLPDGKHSGYRTKYCEYDAIPRIGDMLHFSLIDDSHGTPFGKVESVDWRNGHAVLWCEGEELWDNGGEESDLLSAGWSKNDPWHMCYAVTLPDAMIAAADEGVQTTGNDNAK
jgi:hypothetical protein